MLTGQDVIPAMLVSSAGTRNRGDQHDDDESDGSDDGGYRDQSFF